MIEPKNTLYLQLASFLALSLAWQVPSPTIGSELPWQEPVVGSKQINSYLAPLDAYSAGHRGIDYEVDLNQAVFAPADGQVHFVGQVVNRSLISLSHDENTLSSFEPVCSTLAKGQKVSSGDLIGEVCEADSSYKQHCQEQFCLHFSTRKNGEYISPMWLLGDLPPSRLLPWIEPK